MNTCHWKCLAGLTVVCLIFISGPVPLLADENQDMIDEASREFGKASEATKEAQNNTPQESVRRPENDLDKAAKKNDDVQADPKSTQQQKDDARKAEDAARAKADDARKDYHDPGKAETYRKALEKRREARKNLKIHTPFSGEPKKELESIVQQTVWAANPTHDGNATTKEDLTRTIYKQVKPQTEEQKKALQPGINNIWGAVQLTGKTAKVIVEPGQTPAYELTGAVAKPETITTDAPSGTSAVETSTPSEEKPAPPPNHRKAALPPTQSAQG